MNSDVEAATPALCRLQLGNELRQLRLAAGLKGSQVVSKLRWSPSKLTRLETGENASVEPDDVAALCDIYQAGTEARERLHGYAVVTCIKRDWWHSREYRPVIGAGLKAFLDLEATATSLQTYESEFVPGLLQTEAYVYAIHQIHQRAREALSAQDMDRMAAVRTTRAEVLSRPDSPLKFTAIVNEAVLRRPVGRPPVMRDQLTHIVEVVESLPNVRVQVMPFRVGAHAGMDGPFVVIHFPERLALKPMIYLENLSDAWVKRSDSDVEQYGDAFSDLQALAPGPQESLSMIKEAIKEH
ncbi:XRE family transcriptional regulator [Streptomyces sp. AcH 505]|uniref:helix-turn-helix domain-containing protein n=1 Tax=Streptomyces sp. AcH 505 TaxID=352211 RepID=UPI00059221AD|nr:XRE family transcriptional regulator [Streptomyces sp. AcH 505]